MTHIHALSGVQTHNPSIQATMIHALDRAAIVTGILTHYLFQINLHTFR